MQPEFKYGFIAGAVISISFYIDEMFPENPSVPMVTQFIIFGAIGVGIYFAMKEKRENSSNVLSQDNNRIKESLTRSTFSVFFGAIFGSLIYNSTLVKEKEKRTIIKKNFPYSKAILAGVIACFYMSCVAGAYSFCYVKFMNPDKAKQVTEQKMKEWKQQDIAPDKIDAKVKEIETVYSPVGQLESTIGMMMLLGLLIAAVMALFMQTKT